MRDKLLIIGPIGYQGGRSIEVHMLATGFSESFDVEIFSLIKTDPNDQTEESQFIKSSSLLQLVVKKSFIFRWLTWLSFLRNKRKGDFIDYLGSSVSKKVFALNHFKKKLIKKKLLETDHIFICADMSSAFIKDIIEYGKSHNKKIFFRTTGTIKHITKEQERFLSKVNVFMHHSLSNANRLSAYFKHQYEVIDQAAHNEQHLVTLPFKEERSKVFGYLGRLSPEKGIETLLEVIKELRQDCHFIIAGNGPLSDQVENVVNEYTNVEAIGWIDDLAIKDFFKKIDCLIIPSLEESGPLVAIEAFCAARLLITTRVGAMEERLKPISRTFFCNTGDSEDLAQTISEVISLSPQEVQKIGREHRDLYIHKFSKKNVLERYRSSVNKEISVL